MRWLLIPSVAVIAGCEPDPVALCIDAHQPTWSQLGAVEIDRQAAMVTDDKTAGFETVRVPYRLAASSGATDSGYAECEWWKGSDYVHIMPRRSEQPREALSQNRFREAKFVPR